jgi:hypothetical protein
VRRRVSGERADQRDDHEPVAVEVVAGDQWAGRADHHDDRSDQDGTEGHHLADDGAPTLAEGAPMGQGSAELLLQRQEEPRREGEGGEPHRGDRFEGFGATDRDVADLEEGVRGDAGDEQRETDRQGALRQWRGCSRRTQAEGHD